MKKVTLTLLVLLLSAGAALAQAPVVDPGWAAIVIREASDGVTGPPVIQDNDDYAIDAIEIAIVAGGQKAGLATDLINGARIDQIETLHIDRLDDVASSGSLYGPYFNIWVTDGLGHYAVLANEPSDAEWAASRWDVPDWAYLSTKRCKVYETPDTGAAGHPGTSWVAGWAQANGGWDGVENLRFEHVAGLVISPPSAAYIQDSANAVGSGAPDELGTDIARGYTWVFGDTASNYLTGGDGFIVDNYSAAAPLAVQNVTLGTSYATIQAAIDAASDGHVIMIDAGTYLERPVCAKQLTFIGADEATVIVDAGAGAVGGSYGWSISADNVSISDLTLVGDVTLSTPRYGFKPSGVANFTLTNVTAKEFYRTGVDLNGVTGASVTDVVSIDNDGHGFALTDCHDVTLTGITASGNAWQGVSVATWGDSYTLGTSGIVFDGVNTFVDPFQLEMGDIANPGVAPAGDAVITYSTDPADLADVTVQAADYTFAVHGEQDDAPSQVRIWLAPDLATAALLPAVGGPVGHFTGDGIYLESLVEDGVWYITPGCSIQAAIDAADPGDVVDVAAGTYVETLQVPKSLTLRGAGKDLTFLKPSTGTPLVTVSANDVTIRDLEMTDDVQLVHGINVTATANLALSGVDFANLGNNPGPGNAYGVAVANDFTGLTVDDCSFVATNLGEYSRAIGIFAANHFALGGFSVSNSAFEYLFVGVYLRSGIDGLDVTGNTFGPFELPDGYAASAGVYLGDGDDTTFNLTNVAVTGNTFTQYTRGVYVWDYGADTTVGDFVISGNTFTNSIWSSGIRFIFGLDGIENYTIAGATNGILIHDNVFTQDAAVGANVALVDLRTYDANLPACDIDVTDNEMTFTGAPYADAMYGIKFLAGACGFTNTVVSGNVLDGGGTGGAGAIGASGLSLSHYADAYTWPGDLEMDLVDNVVTGFDYGLTIYDSVDAVYGGLPAGTDMAVHGNDFGGNTNGIWNPDSAPIDAEDNWWGHVTGPLDASDDTAAGGLYNPLGLGVPVTDNVDYEPWSGLPAAAVTPAASGPLNCSRNATLTFSYAPGDYDTPDVFLYNAVVSATAGLDFGAIEDLEPFGTINNNFFAMETGPNQWTITGSTVGSPTFPITGPADLFSIVFSATGDVVGDVVIESLTLRDPDNNTIPVTLEGATITYDCTAPAAVTGITAAPGHNKVEVGWSHVGVDVDHYLVYRGLWYDTTPGVSAYPEYDDLVGSAVPVRPAAGLPDPGQGWVRVDDDGVFFPAESFFDVFTDFEPLDPPRGVYYYEVYAVDAAGNVSPPAAANDRATNYWLGDVDQSPGGSTPDGTVDPFDMNVLGTYFGTAIATGDPGCEADVGPTDDWSRLGVPTTDSFINFEDLMVFAMNFGVVSGAKSTAPVGKSVDLAWVDYEDGTMALRLLGGENLKGLRVVADAPVHGVTAGALLDEQAELTFLKNVGGKLDASVAVMGVNNTFSGTGDLLVVEADAVIAMDDISITARGADNSTLELRLDALSDTPTPRVFALGDNYPNPFNPQTKIAFSLPEAHHVQLTIYSVDGTKVATILDEVRTAGLHEILWTGRDDGGRSVASGTYFYRIEAGPYSDVKKMTLMK